MQALEGNIQVPWQIHKIIKDILKWREQGIQITANHIFKETNMIADCLFKFGYSITNSFLTDLCFSPNLKLIIADDVVGRTFVRKDV